MKEEKALYLLNIISGTKIKQEGTVPSVAPFAVTSLFKVQTLIIHSFIHPSIYLENTDNFLYLETASMEEKESSFSGSPGFSDSDSPPKPVTTSLPHSMTVTNSGGAIVSPESAAITTTTTAASGGDLLGKKKRGRPRKYDSDGNLRVPTTTSYQSPAFAFLSKKIRGTNPASPNFQFFSSLGETFWPHCNTLVLFGY